MTPIWTSGQLDLILVGAVSKDEVIYDGRTNKLLGGAVTHGSASAHRSGARVGVITKMADEDMELAKELEPDNIELMVLPSRETTSIRNIYHSADKERRTCIPLAVADPFTPNDLCGLKSKIIHGAALICGEIPLDTLESMTRIGETGLDVQGFLRTCREDELIFEPWADKEKGLALVTYLKTDAAEAEVMTGETDIAKAALEMEKMGPREVIVSHNKEIVLAYDKGIFRAPLSFRNLDGRTGRGDTLFGSYLARRAHGDSPKQALLFAAALVSLKLETPGPFRGTLQDVLSKLKV